MKILIAVVLTAIVSSGVTLLIAYRRPTPEAAIPPGGAASAAKQSQAWLDLKKQSANLDAQLADAINEDAKNSADASVKFKAYRDYCDAEMDLFSKEEALYQREHDSEESPIVIEQREATSAWCSRVKDLYSFMADPRNGYRVKGSEISANDVQTYNRLMLAFRVASIRVVNANAAEASAEAGQ